MSSLRSHEGYFLLDHRESPGMPDEVAVNIGLWPGAGRGVTEAPSYTCKHCQRIIIMNPKRNRERVFCRGCNHLICDDCGAERARTMRCRTFDQYVDELLSKVQTP